VTFLLLVSSASALETGYCVTAEVKDISPSFIGIDEEFTVGLQIENCGNKLPEFISFELINFPSDLELKEPLIINIPSLNYANSERFLTYHLKTKKDVKPGQYVLKGKLIYGGADSFFSQEKNISFNVIGKRAELNIASLKTKPVLPRVGETVELTMRIENTGKGSAKSTSVYSDHQFEGTKQSFVGALDSNEDGPAVLTFIFC